MTSRSPAARPARLVRALVALALLITLAGASRAQAAEKALWGPAALPDGSSAFGLYDELGIDTLQLSLDWSSVAASRPATPTDPADPAYSWPPELAAAANQAAQHGIRISLLVASSPGWSNGGRAAVWGPTDPQDYADFLTAAARRYPSVHRWMIWGEPNRDDRFQPNQANGPAGPRAYASLLDAAYAALKRGTPRNIVIGGNTWTSGTVRPARFLHWMRLPNGTRPRLDWFGHNPFPFRFPRLGDPPLAGGYRDISDTDTFSREVRRAYGRPVPLWLSEYTIQSDHASSTFATFVSRAAQARYLTAGFRLADDLGPAVAGIGWLALQDKGPAADSADYGLLSSGLDRKPAFAAMARAPSERGRPAVQVASTVARASIRAPGLVVGVTPRAAGTVVVELRRGSALRVRVRARLSAGQRATERLRAAVAAGRYTIVVRAPGGATIRRGLRVR